MSLEHCVVLDSLDRVSLDWPIPDDAMPIPDDGSLDHVM